jgi:4,5-DOPA dioxygenase extradiol
MLAMENGPWHAAMKHWADRLRDVRAIVVASAHWESSGSFRVTSAARPGMLYDFSGFAEELYHLRYDAPGDPVLADRIVGLLRSAGLEAAADDRRPLDHGAWVPLRALFPEAKLPVIQISLPHPRDPGLLVQAGQALAPLRAEGVLLLGSGGLVHNLRRLAWDGHPAPEAWATRFEKWMLDGIEAGDLERLTRAEQLAPGYAQAAPTSEHLDPVYFSLGAARNSTPATFYDSWQHGNLSLRALAWS